MMPLRSSIPLLGVLLLTLLRCGGAVGAEEEPEGGFLPEEPDLSDLRHQHSDLCGATAFNYASHPDCRVVDRPEQIVPESCSVDLCPSFPPFEPCPGDPADLADRAALLRSLLKARECDLRVRWRARPFSGGEPLECGAIVTTYAGDLNGNPLAVFPETENPPPECAVRDPSP